MIFSESRSGMAKGEKIPLVEERAENSVRIIFESMGEEIGWFNETSAPNKIADSEILQVSGYDVDFLRMHHRVRDLLEANARWNGKLFNGFSAPKEIYDRIAGKMPMPVELLDEHGEKTGRKIDLRAMAQLVRIEEVNGYLGAKKFGHHELLSRFINGENLSVDIGGDPKGKKDKLDLRAICPADDMKDFDFDAYMKGVEQNHIGFQWLGGLRDSALSKHHIENSSRTLFIETGRILPNGNREYLWMPVSETLEAEDARTDLPKQSIPFRAEGHVHEVGNYCETNGTTVKFNIRMLKMHRGDVSLRDHNKTNTRMNHAAVGLAAKEEMMVMPNQEVACPDGKKHKLNVVVVGSNRKGAIYKGLESTYNFAMQKIRGYGLTPEEADDLIFTDIIAPFIYSNAQDWLMCFAKSAKAGTGYTAEKAVVAGGDDWMNFGKKEGRTGFCVAIPCRDGDSDTGLKYFFNYNELIQYVNKRVAEGGIDGADPETQIPEFSGMSEAQMKRETLDATEDEEDANEKLDELNYESFRALAELLRKIFGEKWDEIFKEFIVAGPRAVVSIGGKRQQVVEFLEEKLRTENYPEIIQITGSGDEAGKKNLLAMFRRLTPELRKDLREYLINGKGPEKRPQSTTPPEIAKIIRDTEPRMADFMMAVQYCKDVVGERPGFKEVVASAREGNEKKLSASRWGGILMEVSKLIRACRSDEKVRSAIGTNMTNGRWLLREALVQSRRFDDLKDLGL